MPRLSVLAVLLSLTAAPAAAQFPPDSLRNIQVLPEDITVRELINTMRGFALGLGVRCTHCHVGEEGQPLSSYDFVSDDKDTKKKAREMLEMVRAINEQHLARLPDRGTPKVDVQCATCHRGQSRPLMIEDVLAHTLAEQGIDSAKAKYRELRQEYYGSFSYDFTDLTLGLFAQELAGRQQFDAALAMLELNQEFHGASAGLEFQFGEVYRVKGDRAEALARYRKALELEPEFRPAQMRIRQLEGNQ